MVWPWYGYGMSMVWYGYGMSMVWHGYGMSMGRRPYPTGDPGMDGYRRYDPSFPPIPSSPHPILPPSHPPPIPSSPHPILPPSHPPPIPSSPVPSSPRPILPPSHPPPIPSSPPSHPSPHPIVLPVNSIPPSCSSERIPFGRPLLSPHPLSAPLLPRSRFPSQSSHVPLLCSAGDYGRRSMLSDSEYTRRPTMLRERGDVYRSSVVEAPQPRPIPSLRPTHFPSSSCQTRLSPFGSSSLTGSSLDLVDSASRQTGPSLSSLTGSSLDPVDSAFSQAAAYTSRFQQQHQQQQQQVPPSQQQQQQYQQQPPSLLDGGNTTLGGTGVAAATRSVERYMSYLSGRSSRRPNLAANPNPLLIPAASSGAFAGSNISPTSEPEANAFRRHRSRRRAIQEDRMALGGSSRMHMLHTRSGALQGMASPGEGGSGGSIVGMGMGHGASGAVSENEGAMMMMMGGGGGGGGGRMAGEDWCVGGRMGGWEGGWEGGREDGRVGGRMGGWVGGRMGGWEGGWEGGREDGRVGGREDGRVGGREDGRVGGRMVDWVGVEVGREHGWACLGAPALDDAAQTGTRLRYHQQEASRVPWQQLLQRLLLPSLAPLVVLSTPSPRSFIPLLCTSPPPLSCEPYPTLSFQPQPQPCPTAAHRSSSPEHPFISARAKASLGLMNRRAADSAIAFRRSGAGSEDADTPQGSLSSINSEGHLSSAPGSSTTFKPTPPPRRNMGEPSAPRLFSLLLLRRLKSLSSPPPAPNAVPILAAVCRCSFPSILPPTLAAFFVLLANQHQPCCSVRPSLRPSVCPLISTDLYASFIPMPIAALTARIAPFSGPPHSAPSLTPHALLLPLSVLPTPRMRPPLPSYRLNPSCFKTSQTPFPSSHPFAPQKLSPLPRGSSLATTPATPAPTSALGPDPFALTPSSAAAAAAAAAAPDAPSLGASGGFRDSLEQRTVATAAGGAAAAAGAGQAAAAAAGLSGGVGGGGGEGVAGLEGFGGRGEGAGEQMTAAGADGVGQAERREGDEAGASDQTGGEGVEGLGRSAVLERVRETGSGAVLNSLERVVEEEGETTREDGGSGAGERQGEGSSSARRGMDGGQGERGDGHGGMGTVGGERESIQGNEGREGGGGGASEGEGRRGGGGAEGGAESEAERGMTEDAGGRRHDRGLDGREGREAGAVEAGGREKVDTREGERESGGGEDREGGKGDVSKSADDGDEGDVASRGDETHSTNPHTPTTGLSPQPPSSLAISSHHPSSSSLSPHPPPSGNPLVSQHGAAPLLGSASHVGGAVVGGVRVGAGAGSGWVGPGAAAGAVQQLSLLPQQEWTIEFSELRLGIRVGVGSFGEVFRAVWRGTEVAVKMLWEQDAKPEDTEDFYNEIALLSRLRHPNVILFMGACTVPPHLSMVTEYMHMGSLYRIIHSREPGQGGESLSWKRRYKMLRDICRGMLCLQRMSIIHRDLKSANCLVDRHWCVKVCDFGLSRIATNGHVVGRTAAGTPEWMAPELLRNERCSFKCDVFSLGVIMWELATLRRPWEDCNGPLEVAYAVAHHNSRLPVPSTSLGRLISDCWKEDPDQRPDYEEILERLHECEYMDS
ncbi:unnamed protein product [Closterium sp. NIES-65]|nr:unnamed protein product [Closterium sp. NIES-65]